MQGAYASNAEMIGLSSIIMSKLKDRVGKESKLKTMVFAGALDDKTINHIKEAKDYYFTEKRYKELEDIINNNKGKAIDYKVPDGIITGKLENTKEIQTIIAELEKLLKN